MWKMGGKNKRQGDAERDYIIILSKIYDSQKYSNGRENRRSGSIRKKLEEKRKLYDWLFGEKWNERPVKDFFRCLTWTCGYLSWNREHTERVTFFVGFVFVYLLVGEVLPHLNFHSFLCLITQAFSTYIWAPVVCRAPCKSLGRIVNWQARSCPHGAHTLARETEKTN